MLDKPITELISMYSKACGRNNVKTEVINHNEAVLRDFFHFMESADFEITIVDLREEHEEG